MGIIKKFGIMFGFMLGVALTIIGLCGWASVVCLLLAWALSGVWGMAWVYVLLVFSVPIALLLAYREINS